MFRIFAVTILLLSFSNVAYSLDTNSYIEKKRLEAYAIKKHSEKKINSMKQKIANGEPIIYDYSYKVDLKKKYKDVNNIPETSNTGLSGLETASGDSSGQDIVSNQTESNDDGFGDY